MSKSAVANRASSRRPQLAGLLVVLLLTLFLAIGCGEEADPFEGEWHGVGGQQDISWTLVRSGDTTYKIDRGAEEPISLVASDGALIGTTELDLGDQGVMAVQLRITATGPDSLRQEMTVSSEGEQMGPATSMDMIREGAATPSALASSFAPSQDDLSYLNDVRLGMKKLDKSVSLVNEALGAKSVGEAQRKFKTSFTLAMQLARKWQDYPAPSKQLEPLSTAWTEAVTYGTNYVYETVKVFLNISEGRDAGASADEVMSLLKQEQEALAKTKAEVSSLLGLEE